MELNIPNPDTQYLSDAFGITPERVEELAYSLVIHCAWLQRLGRKIA